MRIERSRSAKSASGTSRTRKSGGGDLFARHVDNAMGNSGVARAAPVSHVDALLAVQEVSDATSSPSKARKRAEKMLEGLDELRHGLLLGTIPEKKLRALRDLCREDRSKVDDPRLQAVLDEVDLRAAVELAKYERGY